MATICGVGGQRRGSGVGGGCGGGAVEMPPLPPLLGPGRAHSRRHRPVSPLRGLPPLGPLSHPINQPIHLPLAQSKATQWRNHPSRAIPATHPHLQVLSPPVVVPSPSPPPKRPRPRPPPPANHEPRNQDCFAGAGQRPCRRRGPAPRVRPGRRPGHRCEHARAHTHTHTQRHALALLIPVISASPSPPSAPFLGLSFGGPVSSSDGGSGRWQREQRRTEMR